MWNNVLYTLLAVVLAVIALFTQEIVTFLMLCFVLMALININHTLKRIAEHLEGGRDHACALLHEAAGCPEQMAARRPFLPARRPAPGLLSGWVADLQIFRK